MEHRKENYFDLNDFSLKNAKSMNKSTILISKFNQMKQNWTIHQLERIVNTEKKTNRTEKEIDRKEELKK